MSKKLTKALFPDVTARQDNTRTKDISPIDEPKKEKPKFEESYKQKLEDYPKDNKSGNKTEKSMPWGTDRVEESITKKLFYNK